MPNSSKQPSGGPAGGPVDGPSAKTAAAPNRLAQSTSPYLRQHATNPVDWYPWGPEALATAAREDKPILLSVGYSACHWCHVMAHESFEDPEIAASMNEKFVNIKVDREERPDIDAIYQRVVQLMGEGGGWPLTVFLTPDQRPFYGGTYFPPEPRYGRPGFPQVLEAMSDAWRNRPDAVSKQVQQFQRGFAALEGVVEAQAERASAEPEPSDPEALRVAAERLLSKIDPDWGGFGRQPKFPNASALEVLLRVARDGDALGRKAEAALKTTLDKMGRGGIYDHLRGGFSRYAVDREWLVPHFEKMLYDNAQLLPLYAEAAALWPGQSAFVKIADETVAYLHADMLTPQCTFYAATDADSEGEEGKYFCWTPQEIAEVLADPDLTRTFRTVYGVSDDGNFEHGWSILHLGRTLDERALDLGVSRIELDDRLARAKAALLARRYERVPPLRDDKVLTSWNALLVSGLCRAAAAAEAWDIEESPERIGECTLLAEHAATRLLHAHVDAEGRVLRAEFRGQVHTRGVLDDVAYLSRACLDLHELTLAPSWRARARTLAEHAIAAYARPEHDGFWFTAADAEPLIERLESQHDGPIPAGMAVMIEVLGRLHASGDAPDEAAEIVAKTLARFHGATSEPFAHASLLLAAAHVGPGARHVTVRGPAPEDAEVQALAGAVRRHRLRERHVVTLSFQPHVAVDAIVCRGQVCTAPLHDVADVLAELQRVAV
jgi:uncharacterized protein YyaL (SSP411 family)